MSNSHLPVKCHSVDMEKKEVKNTCNDVSVTFKVKKQQPVDSIKSSKNNKMYAQDS